jgi:hypothetical protein
MRKLANPMARNGTAVLPPRSLRQLLCVRIKLGCCDLRMFVNILLAAGKCLFNIAAEFVLQRIVSYDVGPPEVGFPSSNTAPKSRKTMSSSPTVKSGGFSS